MAVAATRTNWVDAGAAIAHADRWAIITSVAFAAGYPTNGEPLTFAQLGFAQAPDYVIAIGNQNGYTYVYDFTNQKMIVYWGDNNNAADGPAIEVPNATDLSALTAVKFLAVGKYKV